MNRYVLRWAGTLLLVLYLMVPSLVLTGQAGESTSEYTGPEGPSASMVIGPIRVNNNSDLQALKGLNITTGNGTEGDPYILEDVEIYTFSQGDAVYLGNTTDHVLIRDCTFYGDFGIDINDQPFASSPSWMNGIFLNNTRNVKILNTSSISFRGAGILIKGSSAIKIENCTTVDNWYAGIQVEGASNVRILNSTVIYNYENGIELSDVRGGNVENCNITNNRWWGTRIGDMSSQILYYNNTVNMNEGGVLLEGSSKITIEENRINNTVSEGGGTGLYLLNSDHNIILNNVVKNSGFSGLQIGGSIRNDIRGNTLQENSFYDLFVEKVMVPEESDNTILENIGSGDRPILYVNSTVHLSDLTVSELIVCNAPGSTFEDIVVAGSDRYNNNGVFMWGSSNVSLINVSSNFNHYGFSVNKDCTGTLIEGARASGNAIAGIHFNRDSSGEIYGSIINNSLDGIILSSGENRVSGNIVQYCEGRGILLTSQESASGSVVMDNSISHCSYGIYLDGSQSDNHLLDNEISWCTDGILVRGMGGNKIERNDLHNMSTSGITLDASYDDVHCNLIKDSREGILLIAEVDAEVSFNRLINNSGFGLYAFDGTSLNVFHHNVLIENNGATDIYSEQNVQAKDDSGTNLWSWNGYGNYWADWTSPDADLDGVVDDPYVIDPKTPISDEFPLVNMPECPYFIPSAPEDLYSVPDVGKVTIGWSAPYYDGNGMDGYMVFRKDDPTSYMPPDFIGDVNADTLTITDDTGAVGQAYYYYVKAYNSAGESTGSAYVMTASLFPPSDPSVVIETPANGGFLNSSNIIVLWSGDGYGLPILEYEIKVDSGHWVNVAGDTSYQVVGLSDGPHTILIRMMTAMGWHLSEVTSVLVDTTEPTLTLLNTTMLLLINTTSATVQWEGSDADSGVTAYWIRLDDGPWVDLGLVDDHTLTGLGHGTHVVLVRAYDKVGLYDEKTFNITVDLIAPHMVEFGPTGEVQWNETPIDLRFTEEVFDLRVDCDPQIIVGYIWDPQPGDHFRFTYSGFIPEVTYNLTVNCHDKAGNAMTPFTWNFTILSEETQTQNITIHVLITGRILDENGEPLAGIQVILVGVNLTYTDENGYYNFTAEPGTYDIYVNLEGFFEFSRNFTTGNGSRIDLEDIFLREIIEEVEDPIDDEPEKNELPLVPIIIGAVGGGIIGVGIYVMKKRGEKSDWDFEEEGDEDLDFEEEEEDDDLDEE